MCIYVCVCVCVIAHGHYKTIYWHAYFFTWLKSAIKLIWLKLSLKHQLLYSALKQTIKTYISILSSASQCPSKVSTLGMVDGNEARYDTKRSSLHLGRQDNSVFCLHVPHTHYMHHCLIWSHMNPAVNKYVNQAQCSS